MLTSRNDMVIIHINSKKLCLPEQYQVSLNVSMAWGVLLKALLLSEELLVVMTTEKASYFSLLTWPMVGSPYHSARPHTNAHMSNIKWTQGYL